MQPWWESLAPREKMIVAMGGFMLALFLFYELVVAPIHHAFINARATVAQDQSLLAWMKSAAGQISQLQGTGVNATAVSAETLLTTTEESIHSSKIAGEMTSVTQNSNSTVDVKFSRVEFDGLTQWLIDLRQHYGIQAKQVVVTRINGQGMVQADVTLETG